MKKHIPNLLTMGNLFCGCCALVFTFKGRQDVAAWFTVACFVFDYLDGMVARALRVNSPLGKELDSLADVVSFGVVPGAMIYSMLLGATDNVWGALPAFVLSAFSGLRLGKFNLDTRQTNYFIGLSTPACTVFVLGLALTVYYNTFNMGEMIKNQWFLYGITGLFSFLLISEIPMFGMKVKAFDLRSNAINFVFLVLFVILMFFLKTLALSAMVVVYIFTSILSKNKIIQQ